jgi:hypothetical protein
VPEAHTRIASLQHYFKIHQRGQGEFKFSRMTLTTADGIELNFPHSPNNLPLMFLNDLHTLCPKNAHADMVGVTSCMMHEVLTMDVLQRSRHLLFDNTVNLTKPQKELPLWHNHLSHAGLGWIQDLIYVKKGDHSDASVPAIIPATHSVTKQCDLEGIKCPSCLLAKQTKQATGAHQICNNPQREMAIRHQAMRPG